MADATGSSSSADLSTSNTEKLLQFQDLTGIEDIDRCREMLEQHNWDIEVAVHDTFNEREGEPSVFQETRPEPRQPPMNLQPSDQRVFTVARRRPQGLFQWGYFLIALPFRFIYTTVYDFLFFFYRLVRPDPRRFVTDPVGDVMSFVRKFDETYGRSHPIFYQGSYSQALNDAKQELRFLLVYLHNEDQRDIEDFCRTTLCNSDLIDCVNTRMLFWACSISTPEGYRVSQTLKGRLYPFLSLIVLRDNKMTVVARIEGPIESGALIQKLNRVMDDNEAILVAARVEREERSFNQSLRDEQDLAYLESLKADQEKERRRREQEEEKERELQRQRDVELDKQRLLEDRERQKDSLRLEIPEEPSIDDPNSVRLLLKTPSGIRCERRFLKSHSLKYLYYFVFCNPDCPDDFQIVTNFPRKVLPCQPSVENPEPPTFEEAGLKQSEMLFIHDNEA